MPPRLLPTPPEREEQFSVPFPSIPVGGRLTHFLSQCEKVTTDSWVPSVIRGGGASSSVSEVSSTVRDSHLFVSHVRQREADSSVGGSSVFDLERSNTEGSGSFSISRFLLPSFLRSQENWRYETSYRSFYPEYVSLGTPFQNGNQSFQQVLYPPWYVDKKPRSHGCVLSHPYCSSLQKSSSFCLRQYSIPISNTTIRDLNGSPSFHKSVSNSNSPSAHTVCSDSFLSRRFSDQGFRSTNSCFPNGNGNSAFSKSGVFDILEEVGVDSSEFSVSRGTLQNRPGSHFSTRGKMCIPLSENSVVLTPSS